jgi:hypothetical protein
LVIWTEHSRSMDQSKDSAWSSCVYDAIGVTRRAKEARQRDEQRQGGRDGPLANKTGSRRKQIHDLIDGKRAIPWFDGCKWFRLEKKSWEHKI